MQNSEIIHASSVALGGRALLITGAAGSGKSTLALQMLALGAELICDDRTKLWRTGEALQAGPAPHLGGLIETRGLGLLRSPYIESAPVALVADLDRTETDRLPPWRTRNLLGLEIPMLHKLDSPSFPAALLLYLKNGRAEPGPTPPPKADCAP